MPNEKGADSQWHTPSMNKCHDSASEEGGDGRRWKGHLGS